MHADHGYSTSDALRHCIDGRLGRDEALNLADGMDPKRVTIFYNGSHICTVQT